MDEVPGTAPQSEDAPEYDKTKPYWGWPKGKHVCIKCGVQKKATDFTGVSPDPTIIATPTCYLCKAEADRDKLALQLAERKAHHKEKVRKERRKIGLQRLKGHAKQGGIARGLQKTAERKERQAAKKAAQEAMAQQAAVMAVELEPLAMAERELASRELARRSLLHYTERNLPEYEPGWVHEDICRHLEEFMHAVERRESPRLMIWVPPRHGKSELASLQFASWVLGHHPEWEFISTSYSVDLPVGFSRKIKARIGSPEYQALFPNTFLSKDSQAAESWRTTRGGGYRAAGVGGGITGMGAHVLVIDDPVKDQSEADSENIRQAIWDWFGSTAYTRLAPGGGVLCIQTRWHDDDLSGRIERLMLEGQKEYRERLTAALEDIRTARTPMERAEAQQVFEDVKQFGKSIDKWTIVKYPALATDDEYLDARTGKIITGENRSTDSLRGLRKLRSKGDALHTARFPKDLLLKYKRTLQPRHWSALYQQNPVPDEGMFFTKDMVRYRPTLPDHREMFRFAAWDLAIGLKSTNDWTVGIVGALDWDDNLWILDMIRGRWTTHQIASNILDIHTRYDLQMTGIEKGQLEVAIMPTLQALMKERGTYIVLAEGEQALRPVTDKVMRARPLQGRMQQGSVILPADQPWVDTLVNELLRFPTGTHDDCVDALAWLVRLIIGQTPPAHPRDKMRAAGGHKSWRDRLNGMLTEPKGFMGR